MQPLPILTTELTLQIEQCVGPDPERDGEGCEIVRFGKTVARKSRGPWPPSSVFCFNADDVKRLPEILAYFGDVDPLFYLAHGGYGTEVGKALHDAGFWLHEWKQALLYGPTIRDAVPCPSNVAIEVVTPETIELAAEVAAQANQWPQAWREDAKQGVRQSLNRPVLQIFMARFEGVPAGIGYLSKSRATEHWCGLGNAAVIPSYRRRGIHTALLQHRLHAARQAGYELVVSGADFGSTSFRNQQRVGLRLAYVEATWKKR